VAVARDHLRGDVLALETEPLEHARLELRAGGGIGADRARERSHGDLRERALEAQGIAMGLEGEARELYAEGRRLGVDAMRATHTHGLHVFARARLQRLHDGVRAREDDLAHGAQLQGQGGVEHIRRGQAEVDPAPAGFRRFGEHVHEGGDIVLGHELPLADGLHREARRADRLQLSRRRSPVRA